MKRIQACFFAFVFSLVQISGAGPKPDSFTESLTKALLAEGLIGPEAPSTSQDLLSLLMKNGPHELVLPTQVQILRAGDEELPKISLSEVNADVVRISISGAKLISLDLTRSGKMKFSALIL